MTEADPNVLGYGLTELLCDDPDDGTTVDVDGRTATIDLDANETIHCTFGNTQQTATIIVEKQTDPDGDTTLFYFAGIAPGSIADDGQIVVGDLWPGSYTVTESDPGPGFELTAIRCNDGGSASPSFGQLGSRRAVFQLDPGETVKCTFTNAKRSLQVSKALVWPVGAPEGGPAAVDQILRFDIEIFNDGGLTIDPLTLQDTYPWDCMRSRRAYDENGDPLPPDVHGGMAGFLQWNDLGALAPGETKRLSLEFTAAAACPLATNTATVTTGGLTFEDYASLRILDTIARVAGRAYHDDNSSGGLDTPCSGTDVDPAGCEPGLEGAQALLTIPAARSLSGAATDLIHTTNTSGWFSFNLVDPGNYHVSVAPPAGSWWTPTTAEECWVTVVTKWDELHCNVGYLWGSEWDAPPSAMSAVAVDRMTLTPLQDTTLSAWAMGNHGAENYLEVRQPGVTSAAVQFDLSQLPAGAVIISARLRLYSPFASNYTNRLYMTAYPLDKAWGEGEATWLLADAATPWNGSGAVLDHGDPLGWGWLGAPGWVEFEIDPARLLDNAYGFLIRGEGTWNREVAYSFFSREYGNPGVRPRLIVEYSAP